MMKYLAVLLATALLTSCAGHSGPPIPDASLGQSPTLQNSGISSEANSTGVETAQTGAVLHFPGTGNGNAYAASAYIQSLATDALSGPIAPASIYCAVTNNAAHNSVLSLNAAPFVLSSGTADDTVTSTRTTTSGGVVSTSEVQGVSVLNGLIRANVVKAEANSSATSGGASSTENGSELAGLVVAGTPISVTPAPNTKITLPGIGYVTLNEVNGPFNGTSQTHISVNMIHVVVNTANTLGIKLGTNIIVASATSLFTPAPAPFKESATAYSLLANGYAGNINASSGPWAITGIDCRVGSSSNRLLSASTPVGNVGTMVNTVSTTNTVTTSSAQAGSNTATVNLLKSLITASTINTTAKVLRSGAAFTHTGSTQFLALKIAGASIAASVPPNTRVNLPGLGYVILNDQLASNTSTSAYEEVNGLLLVVTTANSYNLPVGARIVVAHAHAQINGY